nr:ulp1 protease family, C-terminal catalytic domain-containing protein [Tanacetum cinerariifolium]
VRSLAEKSDSAYEVAETQENGPRRAKAKAQVEARRKKDFEREPTHHTLLKVSWTNERPLENRELNAIIGAWFTLWRD